VPKSDLTQTNWHDTTSQIMQYHRYYHSVIHTAIKIGTALNKVNSNKLQLMFNINFNCSSNKMQHNHVWLSTLCLLWALPFCFFVMSPNNTPWYFGGQLICKFLQNSSFWGSFLRVGIYMISLYAKRDQLICKYIW